MDLKKAPDEVASTETSAVFYLIGSCIVCTLVVGVAFAMTSGSQPNTTQNNAPQTQADTLAVSAEKAQAQDTQTTEVAPPTETPQQNQAPVATQTSVQPRTDQQACEDSYGSSSSYSGQKNSNGGPVCNCNNGYEWNSNQTSCVAKVVKTGYQICEDTYGHASWDGTSYTSSGGPNCSCDAGYSVSSDGKSCQLQQQQTTQPVGASSASSQQAISSNIDGEFTGWDGETLYKLTNGQYWQQSSYYYYYYYAYGPKVIVYASNGSYKMHVEGSSGQDVTVVPISSVIESRIDGEFTGWEGNTSYTLTNGQIWQQTDYHYHYHYAYSPQVIIYRSYSGVIKMHVIGDTDQDVSVSRIN